jgi:transposase InsO family protein
VNRKKEHGSAIGDSADGIGASPPLRLLRVTAELSRRGMPLNHKRVARIMREDNLLAVRRKQFVTTTDSK